MPLKRQIRLKTAIILPFVLTFLFMILAMAAVQTYRYEQTVKELSSKKLSYLTDSISQRLSDFLNRLFCQSDDCLQRGLSPSLSAQ